MAAAVATCMGHHNEQAVNINAHGTYSLWLLLVQGTGHLRGGITINGLLVRDLQLPLTSKFAFFLRPLPARASELTQHAHRLPHPDLEGR